MIALKKKERHKTPNKWKIKRNGKLYIELITIDRNEQTSPWSSQGHLKERNGIAFRFRKG